MYKNSIIWSAEMRGREKGIKEGREEEKIEIARNALKNNIDIKTISLIRNLSEKEIEELKKKL